MNYRLLRSILFLSVLAALVTIGMKSAAYIVTGSVSLLSDALESGVNLLAALVASFSLWYSNRPADSTHTYGHEKIEYFSSGLEGMLVVVAGIGTIWYAIERIIHPHPLEQLTLGIILSLVASLINLVVALLLLRIGRKHHSIILEADGHHLMTDVFTSVGVVIGLILVSVTGVQTLDPILAILVGINITYMGYKLIARSCDGLMDRALPVEEQNKLRETIRATLPPSADFHHFRTRRAGRRRFLDFHLLVDGKLTVREGHDLAHQVMDAVKHVMPEVECAVHIEPIEDESSWEPDELAQLGEPTGPSGK